MSTAPISSTSKLVEDFISFGNPLNPLFTVVALDYYAKHVLDAENPDVNGFISPEAWKKIAVDIRSRINLNFDGAFFE